MALCVAAVLLAGCGGSGKSRDISYHVGQDRGGSQQHVGVSAEGPQIPANWDRGFNFTGWWHNDYATPQAASSLAALKATGANSVAIIPFWYQAAKDSTTIAPDNRSADDASIRTIVGQAKSLGLKVLFRPMVDVNDGTWRGSITPSDHAAWFASYQAFMDHYADLAKELGVEELSLGAEMGSMAGDEASWRALIKEVRTRYSGTLTYGGNFDDYMKVNWWDALDEIGIDWYGPLANGTTPDEDSIVSAWSKYLPQLTAFQAKWNKPIKFTEIGYTSSSTNLVAPQNKGGTYDGDAQVRAFNAFIRAFLDKPWFRGAYIWHWDVWMDQYGTGDTSHSPQNKPAQASLTNWFTNASTADAAPTPPTTSQTTVTPAPAAPAPAAPRPTTPTTSAPAPSAAPAPESSSPPPPSSDPGSGSSAPAPASSAPAPAQKTPAKKKLTARQKRALAKRKAAARRRAQARARARRSHPD